MSAMDFGLADTAYTGIDDTALGFSGSSTLQDVTAGSPLQLDTSTGLTDFSSYDFWSGGSDPSATLGLSGVSDPPFMSADLSTPNPDGSSLSDNTWSALNALSKFGAGFATLLGNHPTTVQPAPQQISTMHTGQQPVGASNGTSLALLLVIGVALVLLIGRGGE